MAANNTSISPPKQAPRHPAAHSANGKPYALVGVPIRRNQWDDATQTIVAGWQIAAQWRHGGAIFRVFVPDGDDLATTADTLIREQGAKLDGLYQLNTAS